MNKNEFLKLIGTKNPVDRQMLTEINELVHIFPYFQTAHLLLLKGLQDNQDVKFENQLRNSAIHIADREVLYNLLKVEPEPLFQEKFQNQIDEEHHVAPGLIPEPVPEAESGSVTEPIPEPVPEPAPLPEPEPSVQPAVEPVMQPVPETAIQPAVEPVMQPVPETAIQPAVEPVIQPLAEPPLQPFTEPAFQNEPVTSYGDFEQTVIESARNSEDLISEYEKEAFENLPAQPANETDKALTHSIVISAESDIDDAVNTVLIINEETGDVEEKIFYMDPGFSTGESDYDLLKSLDLSLSKSMSLCLSMNLGLSMSLCLSMNLSKNFCLNLNLNNQLLLLQNRSRLTLSINSFRQIQGSSQRGKEVN